MSLTNKQQAKILIIGCGKLGIGLAAELQEAEVFGLRRSAGELANIKTLQADVTNIDSLHILKNHHFDSIIVTLTPSEFSDERYKSIYVDGLANVLKVCSFDFCVFVSSTSVYHQSNEEWVNEQSPTLPESFSGKRLLEAESLLKNHNSCIVRFAGIYGPSRFRLIEQTIAGQGSPELFSNRIHEQDCVRFLAHLLRLRWQGKAIEPLYIGIDNEPVKLSEVKYWIAEQLGYDRSHLTEQAATRRGSKRCSNKQMLESGFSLNYPSFREGYSELIKEFQTKTASY